MFPGEGVFGMTVPHNIIKLQLPDGREVSIIQNGPDRKGCAYGHDFSRARCTWKAKSILA